MSPRGNESNAERKAPVWKEREEDVFGPQLMGDDINHPEADIF